MAVTGPSGWTRVAGVIGDPVRHSLSPAMHNAAYQALGVDWVYVAFPVAAGRGAEAVAALRTLDLAGLSVTMPHKADVVAGLDRLGPTAARLGVVNSIMWDGDDVVGESTDGDGFLEALRQDEGFDPAGRRCVVLGTGGAARAVTLALGGAGVAQVTVVGRRPELAEGCAALAGPLGSTGAIDAIAGADLLVNATPVGMAAGDGFPFGLDPGALGRHQLVVDLIYWPVDTPLLAAARAQGARATNGLGMLTHQAARQVALWTGLEAPLDVMAAAALAQLTG